MHLPTTLSLLATLATLSSAIKVQYYSDGGCTDYILELHPSTDGSCYGYNWNGDKSANIASCEGSSGCRCNFYSGDNCGGGQWTAEFGHNNCASNWDGGGFKSMKCWKY